LLEHPHVVTRGVGASRYTLGGTPHPVFDIERGGDVTYHGPGQLVGYPILHLQERKLLVGRYLRLLEDAIIDALGGFGLEAERRKGFTGVWARGKKIASIGVAVRSWVAFHGFALNVSTDLSQFTGLYPCGLQPERMSTMAALLGREIPMADVKRAVRNTFVAKLSF
jgi:lipoate-protein ligase B